MIHESIDTGSTANLAIGRLSDVVAILFGTTLMSPS